MHEIAALFFNNQEKNLRKISHYIFGFLTDCFYSSFVSHFASAKCLNVNVYCIVIIYCSSTYCIAFKLYCIYAIYCNSMLCLLSLNFVSDASKIP